MRITRKGQVTIPQHIREQAALFPGSDVVFVCDKGGRVYIQLAPGQSRGKALVARLRGRGSVHMSTDEILALTRGRR